MRYTLRPYQQAASETGLAYLMEPKKRARNGIIIQPTGSGKSLVIASIATQLDRPALVFQPSKEILQQNLEKLADYGYRASVFSASMGRREIGQITLATIGSVVRHAEQFADTPYVIIDECFAAGTMVGAKAIETLKPGDTVESFNHETYVVERDRVVAVRRRAVSSQMCIVTVGGRITICTANHPYFSSDRGGYYDAANLAPGERILSVRSVRGGGRPQEQTSSFSVQTDRAYLSQAMRASSPRDMRERVSTNDRAQQERRPSCQGVWDAEEDRSQTEGSRREWASVVDTATDVIRSVRSRVVHGIRCYYRIARTRISTLLQDRHSASEEEARDRSRRVRSFGGPRAVQGQSERLSPSVERVDRVQIYESVGALVAAGYRFDGYVYSLQIDNNENFFADGVLVHNCHLVNAKGGMYREFVELIGRTRVLGLTATPYRLATNSFGAELRFLTRSVPRVFNDVVHVTQIGDLFRDGYLAPVEYREVAILPREKLTINKAGTDYTDASVQTLFGETGFVGRLQDEVERELAAGRKNVLVFTRFVDESVRLSKVIPGCAVVTAETPPKERAHILAAFKDGRIRVVTNVGIVAIGFDFPELECVILARPSISLALYYQQVGRVLRTHPRKRLAYVVDMVGLVKQFGPVEKLVLRQGDTPKRLWEVATDNRQLTNVKFAERDNVVAPGAKRGSFWARRQK